MGVKQSRNSFKSQQNSQSHKKIYSCLKCSSSFNHKRDLKNHLSTCTSSNQRDFKTGKNAKAEIKLQSINIQSQLTPSNSLSKTNNQSNKAENDQRVQIVSQSNNTKKRSNTNISTNLSSSTFNLKVKEFRNEINKLKIDWREGCDSIEVDRSSIVSDSMKGFQHINPFKELKIAFKGEVSLDAGGLIREWLCVLFEHFLDENTNLFIRTDTDDISYLIRQAKDITPTLLESYYFIGQLIGKALLENLTINCCFNKLIYKLILNEIIQDDELVFIDKPLYQSMIELVNMKETISNLYLFFSIEYQDADGVIRSDNLIPNGNAIKVTPDNLNLYIKKRIEYLIDTQMGLANEIRRGIDSIIHIKYLQQFTSDELELILNGAPFIDIEDWRNNTVYKDYIASDVLIKDFWDLMSTSTQEDLSKILQFCTGSSRVPIGGFRSLESNRGNKAMFCITKANYYQNKMNYIRAHTCFNRLDLPSFPNRTELESSIDFILRNEAIGFGID